MENKVFDIKEQNGMKKRFFIASVILFLSIILVFLVLFCITEKDFGILISSLVFAMLVMGSMWAFLYKVIIAAKHTITFKDGQIIVEVAKQTFVITSYSKETISLVDINSVYKNSIYKNRIYKNSNIVMKIMPYGTITDIIDSTILKCLVEYCNNYNIPLVMKPHIKDKVYNLINFKKEKPNTKKIVQSIIVLIVAIALAYIYVTIEYRKNQIIKIPEVTIPDADPIEIPEITIPEVNIPKMDIPEINAPDIKMPDNSK